MSQTLANLEGQIGVKLFDRSARFPVLTDQGRALLADARTVAGNVDLLKARAKSLAGGLEPELSVAVDVMFPPAPFAAAVAAFQQKFPSTLLRFDVESSAVIEPVLDGHCGVGVAGSWSLAPPQLTQERLLTVRVPTVVSPQHPLAKHRGPIPTAIAAKYVRLTHADPADISPTQRFAIGSGRVWRLSHLGAKLAFLRAGLGYGGLPLHMIESGPCKRRARSNHARGRTVRGPCDSHVGDLSNRQSAGAGGTLVHRSPQTTRRTAAEREGALGARLDSLAGEAPAVDLGQAFPREKKETESLTVTSSVVSAGRINNLAEDTLPGG